MITDAQLRPSNAQSATTGTQVSTNTLDLSVARNVGRGAVLRAVVTIDTTYTGGTSIDFQLIQSAASDLSSPDVLASSGAIAAATLVAGYKPLDVAMPNVTKRYLGTRTVVVGTFAAGAHSSHLVEDTDQNTFYPYNTGR